ncbi:Cas10/Cmr2 second palm domain-containing protein [Nocardia nova]
MASKRKKPATPPLTRAQREKLARTAASQRSPVAHGSADNTSGTHPADRVFVDVSVLRVQSYLARTGDLRGFRGASALVSSVTGHDEWHDKLLPGARVNDEAGDIDGVISLEIVPDHDETATDTAARVAAAVVGELRDRLPAAYLSAVLGTGPTYVHAFAHMKHSREQGRLLIDSPPATPELVLAKPCDRCLSWPAVARIADHSGNPTVDQTQEGCIDCLPRYADGTKGHDRRWRPRAESTLLSALQSYQHETVAGFPDAYEFLADGDHLALIYADGNKVGDFIDQAARLPRGIDTRQLAPAIQTATVTALCDGLARVWQPLPEVVPVLPHILGGDDVVLSVRAEHAWTVTTTLLQRFGQLMKNTTAKLTRSGALPTPSMSAGIVFFHRKTPFVDVLDFAATQLRDAKSAVRGSTPSVTFLDIPADGAARPAHRPVWPLRELLDRSEALSRVAALPPARRATLLSLLRAGRRAEAEQRITLQDTTILFDVEDEGITIRDQLDLARWWPRA